MLIKKLLLGLVLLFCIILLGCTPGTREKPSSQDVEKQKLQKQIENDYRNPDLHYRLGKLNQAGGLWSQAEHEFRVVLSFDPVHRPSQAAMVRILLDSGQGGQAKESTTYFMNSASTSDAASLDLGIAFQNEGLDDYALTCYQKALSSCSYVGKGK